MLTIRSSQMAAFEGEAVRRFADRVIPGLRRCFPNQFAIYGEPAVRAAIRHGVDRAEAHGFTSPRDAYLWVVVMLTVGCNFERDIQLPWAREVLSREPAGPASSRADALAASMLRYFERVAGKDHLYINRAILRLARHYEAFIARPLAGDFTTDVMGRLQQMYPKKFAVVGERTMRLLVEQAPSAAARYGIVMGRGIVTYAGLMFMLGSAFDTDPLQTWASSILKDPSLPEADKVAALEAASAAHAAKWAERRI